MILVTGQFFGCRKIHYLCVLQEPNKISDYHYYLPTQELASDLYITSFLSFVSGGTHASLCLSHTVFSVFAFLSPFPFLSLLLTLSYLLCPCRLVEWRGWGWSAFPQSSFACTGGVKSLASQGRCVGRLCSGSSTEKRGRERKPGNWSLGQALSLQSSFYLLFYIGSLSTRDHSINAENPIQIF